MRARLARRLPFYYGWVIFAMASLPSFGARPVASVAVLSVFIVPMTEEFGWSRGFLSGAVSLGAVCGLIVSPVSGALIDRYGSSVMVAGSSVVVGVCALGLAAVSPGWSFYAIYVPGRAAFSSPLELGTSTAVSNWFLRRRPMALAWFNALQGIGLALVPLAAAVIIGGWDWRVAWVCLGVFTLATGIGPPLLLMARRPEDMGLEPDPAPEPGPTPVRQAAPGNFEAGSSAIWSETNYTVREALGTPAFWILAFFSMVGFMVQAGVSLHQVPHYIGEGVQPHLAALTATSFAVGQIPGGLFWSMFAAGLPGVGGSAGGRRAPVRALLSFSALTVAAGSVWTGYSHTLAWGIAAGFVLGIGVGGLHTLLRLAWADYYGRLHLGSIRGLTLPAQIGGQAIGPVVAGFMYDSTGGYREPFFIFGVAVSLAAVLVLAAAPPRRN